MENVKVHVSMTVREVAKHHVETRVRMVVYEATTKNQNIVIYSLNNWR